MSKKKTEKIGVIKGIDLVRKSKPINYIPFREDKYLTQKDRPRDKSYKKERYNYEKY